MQLLARVLRRRRCRRPGRREQARVGDSSHGHSEGAREPISIFVLFFLSFLDDLNAKAHYRRIDLAPHSFVPKPPIQRLDRAFANQYHIIVLAPKPRIDEETLPLDYTNLFGDGFMLWRKDFLLGQVQKVRDIRLDDNLSDDEGDSALIPDCNLSHRIETVE